ncbi:MAG: preprotein translocase subunit SecG [Bdellovibrionaceae bacterium]|nr:preprotein translocase subunit SecG [Pseudobdellovibrionaceae bacterium]
MITLISIIHIIMAVILIILVLLQDSKGGAMGMLSGGSSGSSVFGSTGAGNFLVSATRWVAIFFAATSISLAYITTHKTDSVLDQLPAGAVSESLENSLTPVEKAENQENTKANADDPASTTEQQK